jgi:hypothetical protein
MGFQTRKLGARRRQLRESISVDRAWQISRVIESGIIGSLAILIMFAGGAVVLLGLEAGPAVLGWKSPGQIVALACIVVLVCLGAAVYIYHYERRIVTNYARGIALGGLFILLLGIAKLGLFFSQWIYLATGTAITSAIILTIAYNQRFALAMSAFYSVLVCLAVQRIADMELYLTMMAGVTACCFFLREIRTRTKLLEVSTLGAAAVFAMASVLGFLQGHARVSIFRNAGTAAGVTIVVGMIIQTLLPMIERAFRIATSMTLLDYSDANQPLLKKLAMDAPGTYSHSLLIGSVAESAAEAIGANGLLCRVGAYYHDIGKINKPGYFVENQIGGSSPHEQLSPAMSQLIIVGHVKDGIELAKEYRLPAVLQQFVETHHGTTLVEYFYNEAKKKQHDKQAPPTEAEFRHLGPKPRTKEAAIVMLADSIEGAVRSLPEKALARIEAVVHNIALRRLQDGQLDECDLSLRELAKIEDSFSKSLAAHYHGRVAYPKPPDVPVKATGQQSPARVGD